MPSKSEEDGVLSTLIHFWIPVHAFKGKKGIIYESRHGGRRVFVKHVSRSKHYMRKYEAWAIDEEILVELYERRIEQVYLDVKNEGLLVAPIDNFRQYSITDEYGHGVQAFLPERFWEWVK
jgi:hypothetical protein